MHISEGVLSGPALAAGAATAAAGVAIGLRKLKHSNIPDVAVLTAAFFLASLIRIPAGPLPTSIHLTLVGLMGLSLGWAAFPAIFVGLSLQALLFQFGGLTVLGVNTTVMALPAVVTGALLHPLVRTGRPMYVNALGGFLAGGIGTTLAAAITALALVSTGDSFREIGRIIFVMDFFAAIIEGVVTAFMVVFIIRVRPELLLSLKGAIK